MHRDADRLGGGQRLTRLNPAPVGAAHLNLLRRCASGSEVSCDFSTLCARQSSGRMT